MCCSGLSRRGFLGAAATAVLAVGSRYAISAEPRNAPFPGRPNEGTVRDRLWIWGGAPGATNDEWGHAPSRMTAAEAAFYMGIPNLFLIRHKGRPALEEYDQYALALSPLKRVAWALVESGGETDPERRDYVLKMPARFPNVTGFIMDDYFKQDCGPRSGSPWSASNGCPNEPLESRLPHEGHQTRGEPGEPARLSQ